MQIRFSQDKTSIIVTCDKATDYSALYKFPGLIKNGVSYVMPARKHVAYNLISRLLKKFKGVVVAEDVMQFIQSDMALLELPPEFTFKTKPLKHQLIALRYMYTVGSGGLLLDPGMGKSKVVLDYIKLMGFKRTLVVCPKPLLFVWEDEAEIHRNDLSVHVFGETMKVPVKTVDEEGKKKTSYVVDLDATWEREKVEIESHDVTVINYSRSVTFKDQLKAVGFEFIHLDEFLIKDNSTERTKAMTDISKVIPYKCGGSGTLINNSVLDMYAPVRYLEPSLVGTNYYHFKDRYTISKGPKDSNVKFIVGYRDIDEARAILESCCIVMTKDEWLELPGKTFHKRYTQLSDEQRRIYSELSRNYTTQIEGETLDIDNPLVMISKLYQVANGFVYISKDREEAFELLPEIGDIEVKKAKDRKTVFMPEQPKIAALNSLLDNELKSRKAIIWFNMQAEYTLIHSLLESRGEKFSTIKGGEKHIGDKVREFNRDPTIRWLVCQAKSVNYGITVLGSSPDKLESMNVEALPDVSPEVFTEVFYSLNYSLEVFMQQQDRIHRIGQNHKCEYYLILTNTAVERSIEQILSDKVSIRTDMLVDIATKLTTELNSFVV
jgi:SNF2 family DNA or RNA helicase